MNCARRPLKTIPTKVRDAWDESREFNVAACFWGALVGVGVGLDYHSWVVGLLVAAFFPAVVWVGSLAYLGVMWAICGAVLFPGWCSEQVGRRRYEQAEAAEVHEEVQFLLQPADGCEKDLLRPAGCHETDSANLVRPVEQDQPEPATTVTQPLSD